MAKAAASGGAAAGARPRRKERKNIIAGVTFAYGTAIMAHLYRYEFGIEAMF